MLVDPPKRQADTIFSLLGSPMIIYGSQHTDEGFTSLPDKFSFSLRGFMNCKRCFWLLLKNSGLQEADLSRQTTVFPSASLVVYVLALT